MAVLSRYNNKIKQCVDDNLQHVDEQFQTAGRQELLARLRRLVYSTEPIVEELRTPQRHTE